MKAEQPAPAARRHQLRRLLLAVTCCLLPLILWIMAYQAPARVDLFAGGELASQRRFDDAPFMRNINGPEPPDRAACPDDAARQCWWWELLAPGERPYRWTRGETSAELPGLGGGLYAVEVAARGQPGGGPTPSTWRLGEAPALTVELPPDAIRRYHILVASDPAGDLRVIMETRPFVSAGDPRELGFVLYELHAAQIGAAPRAPAWPQLGWLALAVAGAYGAARALDAGGRIGAALAIGLAVVAAIALAVARPQVAVFAPALAAMGLLAAVAAAAGRAATRPLGLRAPFARQVFALTLLALALRAGGMIHPHALYSDSGFHANKLFALSLGEVFQTAGLPSEAGGGQAPYPTGAYLMLLPAQLLLPDGARVRLVQVGTALLDSLVVPMIALLLARAGLGRRAALLGAACYLLPVSALESFSIGELANIAGQSIAMSFVALLALGALAPGRGRMGAAALATAALAAGLLAHSGVTLSLGAFTAAAWLLALPRLARGPAAARRPSPYAPLTTSPLRLTAAAVIALAIALLIYYSAPVYLGGIIGRVGGAERDEAARAGLPPLAILAETAAGLLGVAPPRARAWALPPLLGAMAIAGAAMLWARREPHAAGLRLALGAFGLGALLTQALLLVADQGVRWSLFIYPALCMGAGVFLGGLYGRGRAGRAAALAALAVVIAYGLFMWVAQVRDYYHV